MDCEQGACSTQGFIAVDKMVVQYLNSSLGREIFAMAVPSQIHTMGGSLPQMCLSCQASTKRSLIMAPRLICNTRTSHENSPTVQHVKRRVVEERWRNFFSDPSQWWDHRVGKTSARYPDFKHKTTKEGLWVHDNSNPDWVKAELAALVPGTVHLPIVFWNKKLARYVRDGQHQKTIELYEQMRKDGRIPDPFTFVPVLRACASLQDLDEGRKIHSHIIQSKCDSDMFVGTNLIDMFVKCGTSEDARRVFNKMSTKDVVTWTAMIVGYVKCGQPQKALDLFELMELHGVEPAPVTFVGVLNACASVLALEKGRRIHQEIIHSGCLSDPYVGSSLVDMYAKCGNMDVAQNLFTTICAHNAVSWTALIMGYVKCGQARKALEQYELMQLEQVDPVPLTFVGILNACASLRALEEGLSIHEQIIHFGYDSDVFVGTSLVDMYVKCGSIEKARMFFNKMAVRTVVSWNAMLTGYVICGQGEQALELYRQMQLEGVDPVPITFVGVLNACASLRVLDEGRQVHAQIIKSQVESNVFVGSSLIDMYAKCGSIEDAWKVFNKMPNRDTAAWTAMIMGYIKCRQGQKALALYQQMQLEGFEPAPDTFIVILKACALEAGSDEDTDSQVFC